MKASEFAQVRWKVGQARVAGVDERARRGASDLHAVEDGSTILHSLKRSRCRSAGGFR